MQKEIINMIIVDIDFYYQASFKTDPETCMPIIGELINKIDGLCRYLAPNDLAHTNSVLSNMMVSMENKDYVRLRDCLYYELKPLLLNIR